MEQPSRLMNRNFLLLWQGQFISRIGSNIYLVAMVLFVKEATESATLMGMMMMIAGLPGVLLGPVAGTVADRFSRRKIIIFSDFLNAIVISGFALLLFIMPDATGLLMAILLLVAVIISIVSSFFLPAVTAAIPDIVPKDKLTGANSMGQLSVQLSLFLGQGTGGFLYNLLGAPILTLLNAITYLYAGISKIFIKIPQKIPTRTRDWKEQFKIFKSDIISGFKYVWNITGLRIVVLVSALISFLSAPIIFLLPFYVTDTLHVAPGWYGVLLSATGVGSLVGYTFAGTTRYSAKRRGSIMIVFILLNAALNGLLGLASDIIIALVISFIIGVLSGFISVNITVTLQMTTPSEIRGRVFGLLSTITGSLAPVSMGLAGVVKDQILKDVPVIYLSCGVIMVLLLIAATMNKDFREYLAVEREINVPLKKESSIAPELI